MKELNKLLSILPEYSSAAFCGRPEMKITLCFAFLMLNDHKNDCLFSIDNFKAR